jgi:CRISPR-associated endoribonuclease Cas6
VSKPEFATTDSSPHTFELFAFRLQFRALSNLYFPPGKAGNVVRGALGKVFRDGVCAPDCPGTKICPQRSQCPYARLFEPTALQPGPSGLADWPRPFVFRAAHLDQHRVSPGGTFHFDLHIFETQNPTLPYFAFSFSQLMRGGLGPGNGAAELTSIHALNGTGEPCALVFNGVSLNNSPPLTLPVIPTEMAAHQSPRRIRVTFLTSTELKAGGEVVRKPEFAVLFARVRDRIHTLRQLYGEGPIPADFATQGERARAVKLTGSDLRWETYERRSGRSGQTHPLAGFVGWAEYEGNLGEFLPYLRAAYWTGVGRQTTWGKGHIDVKVIE